MKKTILTGFFGLTLLFAGHINAQGFYAEVSGGYGIALKESVLGIEQLNDIDNPENSYTKNIYGTLGQGANITITPGYMITEHIGVEIGVNYFKGKETVMEDITTNKPDVYGYGKTTAYSNQFRVIPSLVFNTGGDVIYGYAKAGLVVPVGGSTIGLVDAYSSKITNGIMLQQLEVDTKTNGSLSLGFRGGVGIGYKVTDFMDIGLEVFYTSLSVKAKHREYRKFIVDGVDLAQEPSTAVYRLQIDYVDEMTSESNNQEYLLSIGADPKVDVDRPMEELATKTNFSQLGFQIGLKFRF